MVRLLNSTSIPFWCHPAPSITTTACQPCFVACDINFKCSCIYSLLANGAMMASVLPVAGQTAPNKYADSNCCWRTARGRVPLVAQSRVWVFCWPNLASSWNHTSTRSSAIWPGMLRIVSSWKFFKSVLSRLRLFRMARASGYPGESLLMQ